MDDKKRYNYIFDDDDDVFMTSDTHFFHTNIIDYCKRPFESAEEMNERMIENWNSTVSQDSIVFHLGDFAWGGYGKWKEVRERLNGKIVLIKGNHDIKNITSTAEKELFEFSTFQMHLMIGDREVILNHFPLLTYNGIYREKESQIWQIFGHVHLGKLSVDGKDLERMKYLLPTQYDAGVDLNGFKPVPWKKIKERIEYQVDNNVNCLHWL